MNTDNMSITGLTIDYGPFGFIEDYNPEYTPNHSDHFGRYSYQNQPAIAHWNLNKLAVAMSSILDGDIAQKSLDEFRNMYSAEYVGIMSKKLGLKEQMPEDVGLIKRLLEILTVEVADYTVFYRSLGSLNSVDDTQIVSMFDNKDSISNWLSSYKLRLTAEGSDDKIRKKEMDSVNPKFILRNYLAENAIRKAVDEGDYSEIERLHRILRKPFEEQKEFQDYAEASPEWGKNLEISCSS
jgi:uncharacterized protein YdiU (UPF0061 family)